MRLAASRPFEGARRVFILRADTLNVQAANALLKTLEEPEGETVFALLATSREGYCPRSSPAPRSCGSTPCRRASSRSSCREAPPSQDSLRSSVGEASGSPCGTRRTPSLGTCARRPSEPGSPSQEISRSGMRPSGRSSAAPKPWARRESARLWPSSRAGQAREGRSQTRGKGGEGRRGKRILELLALLYRDAALIESGAQELAANTDRVGRYGGTWRSIPGPIGPGPPVLWGKHARHLRICLSGRRPWR